MCLEVHRQTVTDLLWHVLKELMDIDNLSNFRLVGGTSLSLLLGHRMSIDIDLFTDSEYRTVDFLEILEVLKSKFKYVNHNGWLNESPGNSCFIGNTSEEIIKLDLFYTDPFVFPIIQHEEIRLSSLQEIAAMKLDVIGRGGRKKDFWDIHELLNHFELSEILDFYPKRYPYNFSRDKLIQQLTNFKTAENDPDPICLLGKYWELIKLDFEDKLEGYR